jgi:hypothetical protein
MRYGLLCLIAIGSLGVSSVAMADAPTMLAFTPSANSQTTSYAAAAQGTSTDLSGPARPKTRKRSTFFQFLLPAALVGGGIGAGVTAAATTGSSTPASPG